MSPLHLVQYLVLKLTSILLQSYRLRLVVSSTRVALETILPGSSKPTLSSSGQGSRQVPCIPCIIFPIVSDDTFVFFMQVKKWRSSACRRRVRSWLHHQDHLCMPDQDPDTSSNVFQCWGVLAMYNGKVISIVYCVCLHMFALRRSSSRVSKKIKRGDASSCTPVAWHLVRAASEELEGWRWQPSTSSHWLTPGPRRHSMCAASALPVQCYLRPLRGHHR